MGILFIALPLPTISEHSKLVFLMLLIFRLDGVRLALGCYKALWVD